MEGQFSALDRTEGDIDALSQRLARVRTLAYVSNRADWVIDPEAWQARARELEDRLSDTLHQQLMQRFIDRRTSALIKSLNERSGAILGGIGADGVVRVEGHMVGTLTGLHFEPERGATELENRALRGAVDRAVTPEIARRLNELAVDADESFTVAPDGRIDWRGQTAGEVVGGAPFAPKARIFSELGDPRARERAERRMEQFVAAEAKRLMFPLAKLEQAIADGPLGGAGRGLAYQLVEQFGALDKLQASEQLFALARSDRGLLKALGVVFGAFTLYLPALYRPEARAFGEIFARLAAPDWRPASDGATPLPYPPPPTEALSLRALRAVGRLAAPVLALERLDHFARAAESDGAGLEINPELAQSLGWTAAEMETILRALGFVRMPQPEGKSSWSRRPRFSGAGEAPRRRRRRRRGRKMAEDAPA